MKKELIDNFWKKRAEIPDRYVASRMRKNNRLEYDCHLIRQYIDKNTKLLDLGCGTGLIEEELIEEAAFICAVDKYAEFFEKAYKHPHIEYRRGGVSEYNDGNIYDVIICFGVVFYLDDDELFSMLKNCSQMLAENGYVIIKGQWGIEETVVIDNFSEELQEPYYAIYRKLDDTVKLCEKLGYKVSINDLYPKELNRWENTHEYALILQNQV